MRSIPSYLCILDHARRRMQPCEFLDADRGYIRGKYEPLGIAGDVLQADDFVANQQVVVTQANVLAGFSINGVNDWLSVSGRSRWNLLFPPVAG